MFRYELIVKAECTSCAAITVEALIPDGHVLSTRQSNAEYPEVVVSIEGGVGIVSQLTRWFHRAPFIPPFEMGTLLYYAPTSGIEPRIVRYEAAA